MSMTTEGKSIPEALRMIAQWIDDGREVEWSSMRNRPQDNNGWWLADLSQLLDMDYRAKPRKPRIGDCYGGDIQDVWKAVELTPEVRACLEKEGLI